LLADSLPDRYGHLLIDRWLEDQGRPPGSFNAVERLCYVGKRGMGALEFEPTMGPFTGESVRVDIGRLADLAARILARREGLKASFQQEVREDALIEILRVGTSAGGARAKAVIAWNPGTQEVRSGQVDAGEGFEYWILKFDGVAGGEETNLGEPLGFGAIEYAYARMAVAAGIEMSPSRLFPENDRLHFMTRRFDRGVKGEKIHMQSLCALAHYDFNQAGAYSYEQALAVMRRLGLPMSAHEQQFRRMVFNVVARNQDDHVKNIAFLMDREGRWSLAPAFDLTFSYAPAGRWTSSHQMTVNGKRDNFEKVDLIACAKAGHIKRGRAVSILEEVRETVARWKDFATEAGVRPEYIDYIGKFLRLAELK